MAARRGCRPPSGISSNRRVINEIPGGRTNTGARQARFCSLGKKKSKLAIFLMIRPRRQRLQTLYPNLGYPTSGARPACLGGGHPPRITYAWTKAHITFLVWTLIKRCKDRRGRQPVYYAAQWSELKFYERLICVLSSSANTNFNP